MEPAAPGFGAEYHIDRLAPSERRLLKWARREERRSGHGGLLLEGTKLVLEALEQGLPLEAGWFTGEYAESNRVLLDRVRFAHCRMRAVTSRVMRQVSDLETPPGIAIVGAEPVRTLLRPGDDFSLIVALVQVQDPGNLGGVIRTADYFGVDEVWVGSGSADPFAAKSLRGAMGATLRLPVGRFDDLLLRLKTFRDRGATIVAAVAHGGDEHLPSAHRMILLIGGESRGLSAEETLIAGHLVTLKGAGQSESLNLAMAAGILIYEAKKK
ncbi:MAG: RNA methyltransferase [Calditrichaeota bacterium]|nr:RNA methyltransferase [Calditrichota bacterium]